MYVVFIEISKKDLYFFNTKEDLYLETIDPFLLGKRRLIWLACRCRFTPYLSFLYMLVECPYVAMGKKTL